MFNENSFRNTKQQTVYELNGLFDRERDREYQIKIYSSDRKQVMILGLQPDYSFGVNVYNNDGDEPSVVQAGQLGITTLTNRDVKWGGDDNIKIIKKDGEAKVSLQDTARIDFLKSAYPIGTIYTNYDNSENPSVLMNWNDSVWEELANTQIVVKGDGDKEPEYKTIYSFKRVN